MCFFEILAPVACRRPPRRLRATIVPCFYGPVGQNRRAARKPGDLALECAAFCGPAGPKPRAAREPDDLDPQRTDKIRQNRRTRLQFLDSVSLLAARGVESP